MGDILEKNYGGPGIVSFIVDGKFCDGGEEKQVGWGRFPAPFRHLNWSAVWQVAPDNRASVKRVNVYDRALMTAEAVLLFYNKG